MDNTGRKAHTMANERNRCFIWDTPVTITRLDPLDSEFLVEGSLRAGVDYRIEELAIQPVASLDEKDKAKLTTILLDSRQQGEQRPRVTCDLVRDAQRADPLPPYRRAERLLRYLMTKPEHVGQWIETLPSRDDPKALAWAESTKPEDIAFFLDYLDRMGWIERFHGTLCKITVPGYQHLAEQATKKDLSQCFVAMWFDPSMNQAYEDGIEKAVKECGYKPLRIDQKQHLNKIDDEIIAEIRRSRFVVADFTHDAEQGVRGGVYFEAGFAYGLGLPILYTCQEDLKEKLHFDTRQYPHILWKTPEELYAKLRDKIGAIIGDYKTEPATL